MVAESSDPSTGAAAAGFFALIALAAFILGVFYVLSVILILCHIGNRARKNPFSAAFDIAKNHAFRLFLAALIWIWPPAIIGWLGGGIEYGFNLAGNPVWNAVKFWFSVFVGVYSVVLIIIAYVKAWHDVKVSHDEDAAGTAVGGFNRPG